MYLTSCVMQLQCIIILHQQIICFIGMKYNYEGTLRIAPKKTGVSSILVRRYLDRYEENKENTQYMGTMVN